MGKLFKLVAGLAVAGGALAAITYHLQKKGVVNIEVNYDDENGQPISKPIDKIVDDTVVDLKDKAAVAMQGLTHRAGEVAKDVGQSAKAQLDSLGEQLKKEKDVVVEVAADSVEDLGKEAAAVKAELDAKAETAKAEVKKAVRRKKSPEQS